MAQYSILLSSYPSCSVSRPQNCSTALQVYLAAIAVYAPFFRMSTSSQFSRYLCSFYGQTHVNMNIAVVGNIDQFATNSPLKGSEGLDGMKDHDRMLQKFFRLRDRLCRLSALRSHESRLHLYPP